ncbi:MAG: hypothetical protein JNG84_04895 [Archangium sp.]|nr:hypothetical protein [Archangium sp.]
MNDAKLETLPTRVAQTGDADHRFCGYGVFSDLVSNISAIGLTWLAVGGPRLSADEHIVLDLVAASITMSDPRVWPLKIGRIAASYGNDLAGVAAGTAMFADANVGPWPAGAAAQLLLDFDAGLRGDERDADLDAAASAFLNARTRPVGFGVPFRDEDERLVALRSALERHGGRNRRHFFHLSEILSGISRRERSLEPNIILGISATLLDLGLRNPHAIAVMTLPLVQHTLYANAVEGAGQKSHLFQCLPASVVTYVGPAPRVSPRAAAETSRVGPT